MVVLRLPGGKVEGDIRSVLFIFVSLIGLMKKEARLNSDAFFIVTGSDVLL